MKRRKDQRKLKRAERRQPFLLSPHFPFRISTFCFLLSFLSNADPCAATPSNANSPRGSPPKHKPMPLLWSLADRWAPAAINMALLTELAVSAPPRAPHRITDWQCWLAKFQTKKVDFSLIM